MPKILEGSELEDAVRFMDFAVQKSKDSPCKKDQRGVVIVNEGKIIGQGVNAPPEGYDCTLGNEFGQDYCQPTCRDYAIHAEMNAIIDAYKRGEGFLEGSRMYHAKLDSSGNLADSREPKCLDCSKHILVCGISEFVLKHEKGYTLYSARENYEISLKNSKEKNR